MDLETAKEMAKNLIGKTNWRSDRYGSQDEPGLYGVCFSDLFEMVENITNEEFGQLIELLKFYRNASGKERMEIGFLE